MSCISSPTRTVSPAEDQSENMQSRVYCPNYVVKEAATKLATCRGSAERGHGRSPLGTFFVLPVSMINAEPRCASSHGCLPSSESDLCIISPGREPRLL